VFGPVENDRGRGHLCQAADLVLILRFLLLQDVTGLGVDNDVSLCGHRQLWTGDYATGYDYEKKSTKKDHGPAGTAAP
jgi:hypothetical protein